MTFVIITLTPSVDPPLALPHSNSHWNTEDATLSNEPLLE